MSDEGPCERCAPEFQRLSDELVGAMETIRRQAAALGKARREQGDGLKEHAHWERAQRLFQVWKRETGHVRSKWTTERFKRAIPFLAEYDDEIWVRAICGLAFDHYTTDRANGTKQKHDGWDVLLKSTDKFEEYANRSPLTWRETLEEHAEELAKAKGQQI